ncbi:MAG: 4Fe-4S cluster-binding domain-containing protein [candidate division Zixibacteria bacterium]|nr:4Fe-4S cluster-binding domain-containing protein [candidate division Zixibacteria bacterium]
MLDIIVFAKAGCLFADSRAPLKEEPIGSKEFEECDIPFLTDKYTATPTVQPTWKSSRYNFFFEANDGDYLLYNSMSGGFSLVYPAQVANVITLLGNPNSFELTTDGGKTLFQAAVAGGYILNSNVDELGVLQMVSLLGRFSSEHLQLTIMPTLDCNFQCTYCYEETRPEYMTNEVQEALISWVSEKVQTAKKFTVGWFGGEPLLHLDCIQRLSERFRSLCDTAGVTYFATVVTNGYLMNQDVVNDFEIWGVKNVQITLDGPPHIHNLQRPLQTGGRHITRSSGIWSICAVGTKR